MSKSADGALIARRTPKTRDGVEFTQNTQISQDPVYKQGAIHTIASSIYPQCKRFPQRMCASPAITGIDPQVPCYWTSSTIRLATRKNSMCHPPRANISAYTPGLCVPRCNWPLGAVYRPRRCFDSPQDIWKEKWGIIHTNTQISQDPNYTQGMMHTITLGMYTQCKRPHQRMCASPGTTRIDPQAPCCILWAKCTRAPHILVKTRGDRERFRVYPCAWYVCANVSQPQVLS